MSGKWENPNIPKKGWVCVDIADLGHYPAMTCQMCEKEDIRYAHYMQHPKYKGCLIVGCICAGKMEDGDLEGAKEREKFIKSRIEKKKRWLSRKWKISIKGNQYIKTDDFFVIMKRDKNGFWSALVESESGDYKKWSKEKFRDENKMKLAAFDCLTAVLKEKHFKFKESPQPKPSILPLRQNIFMQPDSSASPVQSHNVLPKRPVPSFSNTPSASPAVKAQAVSVNKTEMQLSLFDDASDQTSETSCDFTPEQKHIFDFVKNGKGHGIIDAVAGAGKTTTIMECSRYVEDKSEILFCAFNKSIQTEIAEKFGKWGMNQVTVKTIHALGYQMLKDCNQTENKLIPQEQKYRTLLQKDSVLNGKIQKYEKKLLRLNGYSHNETESFRQFAARDLLYKFRDRLLDINQKARATLTSDDLEHFKDMILHFNFFSDTDVSAKSFCKELEIYYKCSRILLEEGNKLAKEAMIIDFTDMLYLPYIWNLRASRSYSFLFVDECQDLSKAQLAIVLKYGKKGGRILAVGDPYQSIYGFAGADIESFSRIKSTIKAKSLPLTACFRCPPNVVAMAAGIRKDITASKKENGIIEEITFNSIVKLAKANDLIISRYREPLLFLVFEFINKNIQVQIHKDEVSEIIDELKRLFRQEERAAVISDIQGGFEELKQMVFNRWLFIIKQESKKILNSAEAEIYIQTRTEYLNNKLEFMHKKYLQWKTKCFTVNDMLVNIKEFICAEGNCVKLSTIHRAKGLEAGRVFILNFNELPHFTPGQKPWERTQEQNLKYVAITRAQNELYLVKSQKRGDMKSNASLFDEFKMEMR